MHFILLLAFFRNLVNAHLHMEVNTLAVLVLVTLSLAEVGPKSSRHV